MTRGYPQDPARKCNPFRCITLSLFEIIIGYIDKFVGGCKSMIHVCIIQGKGMDLRGKVDTDIFGYDTLDEINSKIGDFAAGLDMQVQFFHTNLESKVIDIVGDVQLTGFQALIFNPGGFTISPGRICDSLKELTIPTYEIHTTNPSSRGIISKVQGVCSGSVYGFGVYSYFLALTGLKQLLSLETQRGL